MTTSTPTGRPKVDLTDPADLLAAIPYLLGFRPENSIVLFGQRGPDRKQQGLILRADLPPSNLESLQADDLASRLAATAHTGTIAVVVGGGSRSAGGRLPRRRFVRRLESALAEYGIPLLHSLWAPRIDAGVVWGCYREKDCGGTLPDPRDSVTAAVLTAAGQITRESREEVERLFEPGPPETLARRADLMNSRADPPWGDADVIEAAVSEVNAALARVAAGDRTITDELAVRLAWALSLVEVRGACLLTAAPADSELARTAHDLWFVLVRELPEPECVEALCLLAHASYLRGDLAVAGMALARAREVDPEHGLTGVLLRALDTMIHPSQVAASILEQRAAEPPALSLEPPGGTA
jgi:hypothetical protein